MISGMICHRVLRPRNSLIEREKVYNQIPAYRTVLTFGKRDPLLTRFVRQRKTDLCQGDMSFQGRLVPRVLESGEAGVEDTTPITPSCSSARQMSQSDGLIRVCNLFGSWQ